jgi:hypothetical protein
VAGKGGVPEARREKWVARERMGRMGRMGMRDGFLPPHGNYRELKSFQKAEIVHDVTYRFCARFLKKGDRTIDQMVQAGEQAKK